MKRVMVVGSRGFYGQLTVDALRSLEGLDVVPTARRGSPRVDLSDPESFAAMADADAVVNCADTVAAPPDAAIRWCLDRGVTWFEMGADATTAERLLGLGAFGKGLAIVGVGVFPGLSTALAQSLVTDDTRAIELAIRVSPLSGSGPGNCALMVETLTTPTVVFDGAKRTEGPAVGESIEVVFAEAGRRSARAVPLPDAALIHHQAPKARVAVYMALKPAFLMVNFRILAGLMGRVAVLRRPLGWLLKQSLVFMRAVALRKVGTAVEMTAMADRGTASERTVAVAFPDGHDATALGVAAAVALWSEGAETMPTGIHTVGQLFTFEALSGKVEALGGKIDRH